MPPPESDPTSPGQNGSGSPAASTPANGAPEASEQQTESGEQELSPPARILAIDTALDACSVALYDSRKDKALALESLDMGRGHAEALLPMIERVMHAADAEFESIDRIATTVGPGSFTGLRVGIAAARGIALVTGKPVVGVSTLEALSAPHVSENGTVPVVAAIDARHDNLYLQMAGAGGRLLIAPRVMSLAEALQSVAVGLVRIVGNGTNLLVSHWPAPGVPAPILLDARAAPDILWVARLGARLDAQSAPPRPLYLRAPDARPQDAHRLPRQ